MQKYNSKMFLHKIYLTENVESDVPPNLLGVERVSCFDFAIPLVSKLQGARLEAVEFFDLLQVLSSQELVGGCQQVLCCLNRVG